MSVERKHPLAFDVEGNPLSLPPEAVAWRVRRGGGRRGRPRMVFDSETGRQLEIPVVAALDDLIDRGCPPDRYRLEAVDAEGRSIPGMVAIVEIADDREEEPAEEKPRDATVDALREMTGLLRQAMDTQCRTVEALASAFGSVRPVEPAPVVVAPPPQAAGVQPEQLFNTLMSGAQALAGAWQAGTKMASGGGGGTP
jgi:hypothetical protein